MLYRSWYHAIGAVVALYNLETRISWQSRRKIGYKKLNEIRVLLFG